MGCGGKCFEVDTIRLLTDYFFETGFSLILTSYTHTHTHTVIISVTHSAATKYQHCQRVTLWDSARGRITKLI